MTRTCTSRVDRDWRQSGDGGFQVPKFKCGTACRLGPSRSRPMTDPGPGVAGPGPDSDSNSGPSRCKESSSGASAGNAALAGPGHRGTVTTHSSPGAAARARPQPQPASLGGLAACPPGRAKPVPGGWFFLARSASSCRSSGGRLGLVRSSPDLPRLVTRSLSFTRAHGPVFAESVRRNITIQAPSRRRRAA
jgi:hypothetical protein